VPKAEEKSRGAERGDTIDLISEIKGNEGRGGPASAESTSRGEDIARGLILQKAFEGASKRLHLTENGYEGAG